MCNTQPALSGTVELKSILTFEISEIYGDPPSKET